MNRSRLGDLRRDQVSHHDHLNIECVPDVPLTPMEKVVATPQQNPPPMCAETLQSTSSSRAKILFLDGLRGFAAVLVVCQHLGVSKGRHIGAVGVHTFFVLSAFLLTMLLELKLRALVREKASPKRWILALTDYAIRRILRIYPLVMAVGVMLQLSSDQSKHQWYDFNNNRSSFSFFKLLIFADNHHSYVFWTLPRELVYYLLIPFFAGVTIALGRHWWAFIAPLTAWVTYSGLYTFRTAGDDFLAFLPQFVSGSVGAVVFNQLDAWIKRRSFVFRWWHIAPMRVLEISLIVIMYSDVYDAVLFDWFGPYPFRVGDSDHFVSVHVVLIILCEMLAPGPVSSGLEWSVLRYAGKISFSMYLLHPRIIFSTFIRNQHNFYTKAFAQWTLLAFWATVSYHLVEYPSQWVAIERSRHSTRKRRPKYAVMG